jgi:O-antigen ligase
MDSARAWDRLPSAISLCALYLVCVSFRFTEAELRFILYLVVLGGVIAALLALKGFSAGITGPRASLMIGEQEANPNDFASSLLLPFAFALTGFFASRSWPRKTLLLMVLGLLMLCVLLTMSRGSLFALGVLGLVFMVRTGTGMRKQVVVPIVLVLVLLFFLPNAFFSRMEEGANNRATGRFDIWVVGAKIIEHHGIVGAGLHNFEAAFNEFAGYAPVFRGWDRDPHDIYLEVCSEMGVIGLLLFLAAIASQLRAAHRQMKRGGRRNPQYLLIAAEAACWGLLAHGLGANLLWRKHFWLAWILLAIVARPAPAAAELNADHA